MMTRRKEEEKKRRKDMGRERECVCVCVCLCVCLCQEVYKRNKSKTIPSVERERKNKRTTFHSLQSGDHANART